MSLGLRARVARHPKRSVAAPQPQALDRSRLDRLLGSRDGPRARRLLAFLEKMTLEDGAALLALIRVDDWPNATREARQNVLAIINNRVINLRERANLPPLDDSLPGAPANVFMRLREMLGS